MIPFTKLIFVLLITMFAQVTFAAGGHDGIPFAFITKQAINFTMFVAALVFLTKNVIRSHFKAKHEEFTSHLRKAQAAKEEAEQKQKAIRERLTKLEKSADESLEQAKAEAQELKHKLLAEAETLSKKLENEAHNTAQLELDRATFHLREELLANSIKLADQTLRDKVDAAEQKRLRSEFVEKIQVVQ